MGIVGLLAFVVLCSQCILALGCVPSPLWMFSDPEDVRSIFLNIEESLVLVEDGVPDPVLTQRAFAFGSLIVTNDIVEIPIIWCIVSEEDQELEYSLAEVASEDVASVEAFLTVPTEGTIVTTPYRFRLVFNCSSSNTGDTVGMTVRINMTKPGVDYCPVEFYFSKRCRRNEGQLAPEELPTILLNAGITDGFLDSSILSAKTTESPSKVIRTDRTVDIVLQAVLIPLSVIIIITSAVIVLVWLRWYRRSKKAIAEFSPEAISDAYMSVYTSVVPRGKHEKEFPLDKLKIIRELGEGAFGVVSQAIAQGIVEGSEQTDVAVKQLHHGSSEADEFFREVEFMSGLDHPNIVTLLGVCSAEEPFSMIFEYMDLGDLCSFLRDAVGLGKDVEEGADLSHKFDTDEPIEPLLTNQELLTIVLQVAKGMEYISSKHLVHRDLAARNCLVATGLVVKIADFGMSRNINSTDYYRVKGSAMLPVRWMPPESLLYGKFTVHSDIWAFGVLLWETFTFGQQPYFGFTNEEVFSHVKERQHLTPPPDCPTHQLMTKCWNQNPKKRPPFEECTKHIEQLLAEET